MTFLAVLSDVPAQALQQALKNLERGYTNFFEKRAEFPKFKKKGQRESFRVPQGFGNGRIKLPKAAPAHCQHQKRVSTSVLERDQQKPRGRVCRGPASKENVQVQHRHEGPAGGRDSPR